jgi:haloalkane dehalogenase
MPYRKKTAEVLDRRMAYVDVGYGDPIVFLHGNPTSSYLWRNVIPHLEPLGRCVAPDLIGMGDSDKLKSSGPGSYTFQQHRKYLDELLDRLAIDKNAILVVHDWGSGLGFDWARRNRDKVAGIAYLEAIVQPVSWDDWPEGARNIFQAMRSPAGEQIVLEKNVFVERILPSSILRELQPEEMDEYRRPFAKGGEHRRPTLTWPRQIPVDGEPADVVRIVKDYGKWLAEDDSPPKLFINADPGSILVGRQREFCRRWPNQEEVTVPGLHFVQEDSPDEIGKAVAIFVSRVRSQNRQGIGPRHLYKGS